MSAILTPWARKALPVLALALAACTTPYVPYACRGLFNVCSGYSETRLAPGVYQV